eukprot:scaffold1334_cov170-Ochromonas_danica.AAC.1
MEEDDALFSYSDLLDEEDGKLLASLSDDAMKISNSEKPVKTDKKMGRLRFYRSTRWSYKRISKYDLRRVFPTMYCNAINGGDFNLLSRFLCRYLSPRCEVVCQDLPTYISPVLKYVGPLEHAQFVQTVAGQVPDYVLRFLGSSIVRPLHTTISIVEAMVRLTGTRLFYQQDMDGTLTQVMNIDIAFKISFHMNRHGSIFKMHY